MTRSRWKWFATATFMLCAAIALAAAVWFLHRIHRPDLVSSDTTPSLRLGSTSFAGGAAIPARLTCDGANLSPNIKLPPAPARSQSWAVVMDDPTAPLGFIHWIVYNLPAGTSELPEGASTGSALPAQAREGRNDFGNFQYRGPCPPNGQHRYRVRAYALDIAPTLPKDETIDALARAATGHIVAFGQMVGFYGR